MRIILLLAAIVLIGIQSAGAARPTAPVPVEVAHIDVGQAKQVNIVSQMASAKGDELDVVLKPKSDQFSVDFNWSGTNYKHVKILVIAGKQWDTIRYFPTITGVRQHHFNLAEMRGVGVDPVGNDLSIEFFTNAASRILPPSGRLIFRFRSGAGPQSELAPHGIKNRAAAPPAEKE